MKRAGPILLLISGALFCFVLGIMAGILAVAPYGYVEAPPTNCAEANPPRPIGAEPR